MKVGTKLGWLFNKRRTATTAGVTLPMPVNPGAIYRPLAANEAMPYVRWPVPYVHQQHVNMCGEACVEMLYRFRGVASGINMGVNPRGAFEGGDSTQALVNTYGQLEAVARPGRASSMRFASILQDRGPFMCSGEFVRFVGMRSAHFIVVTGIWGEIVLIHDPWHGENRRKPLTWFVEKLDDNDCLGCIRE